MATVNGLTAERMLQIEENSVVAGLVDVNGNLLLTKHGGAQINAGNVRGPQGPQGPIGPSGLPPYKGSLGAIGGAVGKYVRVATIDGLSASMGGQLIFDFYGASRISDLEKYSATVHVGQRGDNLLRVDVFEKGNALNKPVWYTKQVSTYGFEIWVFLVTYFDAVQVEDRVSWQGVVTYDQEQTSLPAALTQSNVYVHRNDLLTGTTAERNAHFGVPVGDPAIVALANQKVQWFNTDTGWWESYYSRSDKAGLIAKGLNPAYAGSGWYPTGEGPFYRLQPSATWAAATGTPVRNWDGFVTRNGGPSWFTYDGLTGRIKILKSGRYKVSAWTTQTTGSGTSNHHLRVMNGASYLQHVDGIAVTLVSNLYTKSGAEMEVIIPSGYEVDFFTQSGTLTLHMSSGSGIRGEFLVKYLGPALVSD